MFTDLAIGKMALPPTQRVMGLETFVIPVSNKGPVDVSHASVHDLLPSNVMFVTSQPGGFYDPTSNTVNFNNLQISAGQKVMLSVVVRPMAGGMMVNRVAVGSEVADPDESNNTAMASFQVEGGTTPPKADVTLMASLSPSQPHVAEESVLVFTAKNTGPSAAHGVSVVAAVPGVFAVDATPGGSYDAQNGLLTYQFGTLQPGESRILAVVGRPLTPAFAPLVLRGLIRADEIDPSPMNNVGMVQTTVQPSPAVAGVTWNGVGLQPTHLLVNFTSEVDASLA